MDEAIAIVGIGCRFPGGANSPQRLWELLRNPTDLARKVPEDRFNMDAFYHSQAGHHGTTYVSESYFLDEDIKKFDAPFFNISPAEAAAMDPQQRLLLETVYESLDRAGLALEKLQGSQTGVFCGLMRHDYHQLLATDVETNPPYALAGTAASILANRVSYFFDWHGPSMTVDTACSSSLVALHLACESLRKGESSLAVVAGSNLILSPDPYIWEAKMQLLSPSNRCHMWDASADGFACGEGVAAVVLKRLSDTSGDEIDCLIRATGVNSDGRSAGLVMPNGDAQQALMSSTYARAGLDPRRNPYDRCQFFEAHGTGTRAGDPQEAAAIHSFFWGDRSDNYEHENPIYVGSAKTIIGHTEGTAGLAGIIRSALALKHAVIPPNLHFHKQSNRVDPYIAHLEVPTQALPWPDLPAGVPRRASVSSFGLGGMNAHAILENFDQAQLFSQDRPQCQQPLLPVVLSAASTVTLGDMLQQYAEWLREHPTVDLLDLGSSLLTRRSAFRHRKFFTATSPDELRQKIEHDMKHCTNGSMSTVALRPGQKEKQILGIFNGQGTQWPQMGLDLIQACPEAMSWMRQLQQSLDELPEKYHPDFTLLDELSAPETSSRLNTAAISLPVRTALQIIQVNMLRVLGISFTAVVGHSSGEIAAAYAAGVLSAPDAIRVAYLRGFVINELASHGRMMAVNLSEHQANTICSDSRYQGRVAMAACNAPSNVTLSGEHETLEELEWLLQSLDRHPRRLTTDVAYHSHHMRACTESYLRALESCNIKVQPPTSTQWYSSVYRGRAVNAADAALDGAYWCENLLCPVLFFAALTACLEQIPGIDMIIEVGPKAALQGPTRQTLVNMHPKGPEIPHIGLARPGKSTIESMAIAIGWLWAYHGAQELQVQQYMRLFAPCRDVRYLKSLPTYPFDHRTSYWAEPRLAKARLRRRTSPNPLLGALSAESGQGEWRWRNYLRCEELPWLVDHQILSEVVFPPMGYIAMVLEAARIMSEGKSLELLEIQQLILERTISIPEDGPGVETLFKVDVESDCDDRISATFQCQANYEGDLERCLSGRITLTLGEPEPTALPSRDEAKSNLRPVNMEDFYYKLQAIGADFSNSFRSMTELKRRQYCVQGVANAPCDELLILHPATMTIALQALWGSIEGTDDGRLPALLLPTRIDSIIINPSCCHPGAIGIDATITHIGAGSVCGNAFVLNAVGDGMVQLEGIHLTPSNPVTDDHNLDISAFGTTVWGPLQPDPTIGTPMELPAAFSIQILQERLAVLYLRDVQAQLTPQDRKQLDWHRSRYVAWMDRILSKIQDGSHPHYPQEWLHGTVDGMISGSLGGTHGTIIRVTNIVGQSLLHFLRGEATILRELRYDNDLLSRYYQNDNAMRIMSYKLGTVVGQIAFRNPCLDILEVGAGTGSATRAVLSSIGRGYQSYTYTDISPAFFEDARAEFAAHSDRVIYQVLDIERDVRDQGFSTHGYDLVIASNVLHATKSLRLALRHVRELVKPSGYFVMLEGTDPDRVAPPFIFGGFEGWWLGEDDGRSWGPLIRSEEWEALLQCAGFGIHTSHTPVEQDNALGMSLILSQAVDGCTQHQHEPLTVPASGPQMNLLLIGGATEATAPIVEELSITLRPYFAHVFSCSAVRYFMPDTKATVLAVLSLVDFDYRLLPNDSETRWQGLEALMKAASCLLWVTSGEDSIDPCYSLNKGFLRSLALDSSFGMLQHLTVVDPTALEVKMLATTFMRLVHTKRASIDFHAVGSPEIELRWKDGIMQIPRIMRSRTINRRLLASRGIPVSDSVDVRTSVLQAVASSDIPGQVTICLVDSMYFPAKNLLPADSLARHDVHYSTRAALEIAGADFLHLVVGRNLSNGTRQLALSASHGSVVTTPSSWCWDIPDSVPAHDEPSFLHAVAGVLVAMAVVRPAVRSQVLWVHDPHVVGPGFQASLASTASMLGVNLQLSTSRRQQDPEILFLHSRSSAQTLARLLPTNISTAVVFGDSPLSRRIPSVLPNGAAQRKLCDFCRPSSSISKEMYIQSVTDALRSACLFTSRTRGYQNSIGTISPEELSRRPMTLQPLEIVNWRQPTRVEAQVLPASSLVTLSLTKTYLVANMTGDLARSVSEWMSRQGARYIVLASDRADLDPSWVAEMLNNGVHLRLMQTDISKQESVLQVDHTIRRSFPPLGGIIYSSLGQLEWPLGRTTLDNLRHQWEPAVHSGRLLDDLYRSYDLEFFIFVGSLLGPIGCAGQCDILATSEFLSGIVSRRRREGRVGSIVYLGDMHGLDSTERSKESPVGAPSLSEREIHEALSEAVIAGRPESDYDPEILAGLRLSDEWSQIPKMWPWMIKTGNSHVNTSPRQKLDARAQLGAATSNEEAADIIMRHLIDKLCSKLGLTASAKIGRATLLHELGIDSLVAVDVHIWLSKELGVKIPITQMMGGDSIGRLAVEAAARLGGTDVRIM
ncbi:hypothetical protein EYZ11_009166 [Aspergillus tanneri]|uniref:Type I Polyketide synthases (Type I PKS) n=1 Tax=Aspergillus tanneri TaxID=1220188 RepID=A0A4S3JAQ1_9EURO|nr:Type I Polyketide synthases (Type I PKS) [Aspergillus tanneri]KAA8648670.1 Type I Polyketide synthases (Type I PKS) [Aspergillus tanneri]THC91367.1 hypothetical protein EYZ11_009166 [Aspergillus tanneri]